MMDERDIKDEIGRALAGLLGLLVLAMMMLRLWRWYSGFEVAKTVWGAIAGSPVVNSRICWDYGFWELFPDGQLAAAAMIALVTTLIAGSVFNIRPLFFVAVGTVVCGYLVNAYFMLKLLAAY